jgi:hypothetical protein
MNNEIETTVLGDVPMKKVKLTIDGMSLAVAVTTMKMAGDDSLLKEMIAIVKSHGFSVVKDGHWESPKEICARLNISLCGTFNRRIKNMPLMETFSADIVKGPSGRVLFVHSNLFFDNYLKGFQNRKK